MICPVYKSGKTHFSATLAATDDDDGDAGSFHLCCLHPGHSKCSFCKSWYEFIQIDFNNHLDVYLGETFSYSIMQDFGMERLHTHAF